MTTKLEQYIEDIENYIENCKYQAFSNTKIIVDKEQIDHLLRNLRVNTPEEIKRYQRIVTQKESILDGAREKAEALIQEAQAHTDRMIDQQEITRQAYEQSKLMVQQAMDQANQIIANAQIEANNVRQDSIKYIDDMLFELQKIVSIGIDTAQTHYGQLLAQLKESEQIIEKNRAELAPQISEMNGMNPNQDQMNLDIINK